MNGKTAKILRKWARIKQYTDKSVKGMWTSFTSPQRKQAKRFFKHVIADTAAAKKKELAGAPAQA